MSLPEQRERLQKALTGDEVEETTMIVLGGLLYTMLEDRGLEDPDWRLALRSLCVAYEIAFKEDPEMWTKAIQAVGDGLVSLSRSIRPHTGRLTAKELTDLLESSS